MTRDVKHQRHGKFKPTSFLSFSSLSLSPSPSLSRPRSLSRSLSHAIRQGQTNTSDTMLQNPRTATSNLFRPHVHMNLCIRALLITQRLALTQISRQDKWKSGRGRRRRMKPGEAGKHNFQNTGPCVARSLPPSFPLTLPHTNRCLAELRPQASWRDSVRLHTFPTHTKTTPLLERLNMKEIGRAHV